MKKGQVYEAIVERVDFPARGVVHVGECTVIVKNCLPGQRISFRIEKVRSGDTARGKAEGRLLEVLEKSPLETERPCSHFGVCGGCAFLTLSYEEQLRLKEVQVKRLLSVCLDKQQEAWEWEGIKGSPVVYEYRNKMEFSFGDEIKDGPLSLGMHKKGSFYDVVTVENCCIVDADYRLILRSVLDYFADADRCGGKVQYFHRLRHEGYLRHLLVRKASRTGEILVALVTTSQNPWGGSATGGAEDDSQKLQECISAGDDVVSCEGTAFQNEMLPGMTEENLLDGFLKTLLNLEQNGSLKGTFAGILHIVNDSLADVVHNDRMDVLHGQEYFYEEILGLKFKVSTFSFFQTNSFGAEVLYETVREYLWSLESGQADSRPGKIVFDLYSGTGTIAQLMAPVADKVIGVEIVEEAVQAARRNAEENGLKNCEFIAGDVLKVLDTIEEKPDLIILDPPRDGVHPKALLKILAYQVEHIVYISCKPTSLARDLEVFLGRGYVVERIVLVDQFPWTANVETVCLLSKLHSDQHIEVELKMDEHDLTAAEGQGCL